MTTPPSDRDALQSSLPSIRCGGRWAEPIPVNRERPAVLAHVAGWLIYAYDVMPRGMWVHWLLGIIDLGDKPGLPPSRKSAPENTHEVLVAAVDPAQGTFISAQHAFDAHPEGLRPLRPINYVWQCMASDEHMARLGGELARGFVEGHLPLEPVGIRINGMSARDYFGQVCAATLEHIATGRHARAGHG